MCLTHAELGYLATRAATLRVHFRSMGSSATGAATSPFFWDHGFGYVTRIVQECRNASARLLVDAIP
ncbi:hypothetical protein NDU88_006081 [Pleurodeles waltl]|uniref:Uncharacterized protein n=1 Tax=Pleurodeles waltl TaxID=8319 RepID=A0AAV7TCH1_PLEWA|nr:hypothetical protein NDU88_006081 [Pleurodeles waltl]